MNIHQLSVNYLPEQDRILLRISTTDSQELRLWLTRRLILGFRPMLGKIVAQWVAKQEAISSPHISPAASADAHTQQMLSDFKRQENIEKADFKTPYQAPSQLPLGQEPLLVTEISVTPLNNGQLQIAFSEKISSPANPALKPRSFRVALEQKLVHGLMHLLDGAMQQSEWGAAFNAPALGSPEDQEKMLIDTGERPKYLN